MCRILSDVDWVWDNTKPVRWNQDMQRLQGTNSTGSLDKLFEECLNEKK